MDRLRVANVYIDGLNLYYGALKDSSYKWLDVSRFATSLLKSDVEVRRVRYFTARLKIHQDPDAPLRQATYLRALDTLAGMSIHYGLFLRHAVSLPRVSGNGTVEVWRSEEKGSDVNLANYLILDAVEEKPDVALVVTNDTDPIVPIREVRSRFWIAVRGGWVRAWPRWRALRATAPGRSRSDAAQHDDRDLAVGRGAVAGEARVRRLHPRVEL